MYFVIDYKDVLEDVYPVQPKVMKILKRPILILCRSKEKNVYK